jgi:molybdenum cofactor guanylyltransferase
VTHLGAIIAGGGARRFGSDKGGAHIGGVALIDAVADALRGQVDALVVVGREWSGIPSIPDRPRPDEGPLGGICAALHHAKAGGYDAVLCVGCDTIPVPLDLLRTLIPGPAVIEGQWLMGLWPVALAETLDAWLSDQPDRSMRAWMRHVDARSVEVAMSFFNINTPDDLARASAHFTRQSK